MPTNFRHPKRKIALAREHIRALEVAEAAFFAAKPYVQFVELNPAGTEELHKVRLAREMPDRIFNLVDQVVASLRAALDKACYATAKADAKSSYFPIADDAVSLERDVINRGRCKDLHPEILTLLRSFSPYKGGNDLVWALNRLSNADKHRNIEPFGFSSGDVHYERVEVSAFTGPVKTGSRWDSSKQELTFLWLPRGAQADYEINIRFFVSLAEVEGFVGEPAVRVLQAVAEEVDRIVLAIEAEAIRLGLTP